MKAIQILIIVLILVCLFISLSITAISAANEIPTSTEKPEEDFKMTPLVRIRPVVDVIEKGQDGIVELYIDNSPKNEVVLHMEMHVSDACVPSGIHIYSEGVAWPPVNEIAYAPLFEIPPGTARTIVIHLKAAENAKVGKHYLLFNGLYYPGNNKKLSMPISLSFPITVKEVSKEIPPTSKLIPTSPESTSVYLHGERTSVTVGEDIVLSLSAINLITKPTMTLQLILKVPSGISVSSADFVESGAGQYTATYIVEPGKERHIGVNIKTNEPGDFTVVGRIVYYFGDDKSNAEYKTKTLPVKVRPISASAQTQTPIANTPGFEVVVAIVGLLAVAYLVGRWK